MRPSFGALLPIAHEAVTIASELTRSRGPGPIIDKGDRDMATELDYAVERAVRAHLHERTPGVPVLGEEEGVTGESGCDLLWALDPIDGTANFVHGVPLWGVSLGLVRGDRAVLGVIDLPFLGARYCAVEHAGARVGDRVLRARAIGSLREAIVAVGDYAVGVGAAERNRPRLALNALLAAEAQRVRMLGSSVIDLVWVAEGRLDVSVSLSNRPWDTAAGVVIAREAGAVVMDHDGSDHTFGSMATIAAAPSLADEVIALLARAGVAPDG